MTKRNNSAAVSASLVASQANAPRGEEEASSPASTNTLRSETELTPESQESDTIDMDASDVLTKGALRQITDNTLGIDNPVVQCLQIKPMASQNGVERFRVVMSDSINFMQGMLGQRKSVVWPSHAPTLTVTRRTQLRRPRQQTQEGQSMPPEAISGELRQRQTHPRYS